MLINHLGTATSRKANDKWPISCWTKRIDAIFTFVSIKILLGANTACIRMMYSDTYSEAESRSGRMMKRLPIIRFLMLHCSRLDTHILSIKNYFCCG
jgi:hypothetical protein